MVEQTVILNKDQLIQLAGLAASADDKWLIITQQVPAERAMALFTPIRIKKLNSGELEVHVMTGTGIHQKVGDTL